MEEENTDKILVICKRVDFKGISKFWKEVDDLYSRGYKYFDEKSIRGSARLHPFPKVWMYKPASTQNIQKLEIRTDKENILTEEPKKLNKGKEEYITEINSLKDYKEMKAYAELHSVAMPDKIYNPKAVRKYLKEVFSQASD